MTAVLPELDLVGPAAPPRSNGELVFAEPWEGRAFGLVMALTERGVLSYEAFRLALITRLEAWEAGHAGEQTEYYRCWLQALEQLLDSQALVAAAEVDTRQAAFTARPAGHDHPGHDHPAGDHEH